MATREYQKLTQIVYFTFTGTTDLGGCRDTAAALVSNIPFSKITSNVPVVSGGDTNVTVVIEYKPNGY